MLWNRVKELCLLDGVSGNEGAVSAYILSQLSSRCDCETDALGSIIAVKKGRNPKHSPRLMLAAHMDEVGLILTHITGEGMLRFAAVGGLDARVVMGANVLVGPQKVAGVIGLKAVHMQESDERDNAPKLDSLLIDIGATSREQAQKVCSPGDFAAFSSAFVEFGDGLIKSKAIDDRAGCALLLELIENGPDCDCTYVFNVQEEVGLRGARATAFSVAPQSAIVLEATTAADTAGTPEGQEVCSLGAGPVISFMDTATIYNRRMVERTFTAAKNAAIPAQAKRAVAGGNDSGAIHTSRGGVETLAISVPCRYIHSPACVCKKSDIEATLALAALMAEEFG